MHGFDDIPVRAFGPLIRVRMPPPARNPFARPPGVAVGRQPAGPSHQLRLSLGCPVLSHFARRNPFRVGTAYRRRPRGGRPRPRQGDGMECDSQRSSKSGGGTGGMIQQWETDDLAQWAPGIRDLFIQIMPSRISGRLLQRAQYDG